MTSVLAIDPGSAGAGNALAFTLDGVLRQVWFERYDRAAGAHVLAGVRRTTGLAIHTIAIERPQQDGRSRAARPEDLMGLAWEGALLAGAYSGVFGAVLVELLPREWKGSESKPQMHARLWAKLTPHERSLLGGEKTGLVIHAAREKGALDRWSKPGVAYYPRAFVTHNLLDAAALALVFGGRLEKRG
jgi:hypothetical protein